MSRQSKSPMEYPLSRETRSTRQAPGKEPSSTVQNVAKAGELVRSLGATRQDKLHRARELVRNAHYPSEEVIESVAKLLARHWRRLGKLSRTPLE